MPLSALLGRVVSNNNIVVNNFFTIVDNVVGNFFATPTGGGSQ